MFNCNKNTHNLKDVPTDVEYIDQQNSNGFYVQFPKKNHFPFISQLISIHVNLNLKYLELKTSIFNLYAYPGAFIQLMFWRNIHFRGIQNSPMGEKKIILL